MMADSYKDIFESKKKILLVFAHPDDAEVFCGGTIKRLTADGKSVRVVKASFGNKGSKQGDITEKDLRVLRQDEDSRAMKVLGISDEDNICLGLWDGEIVNDMKTIGLLAYQIRVFRPELIITHNPEDVIIRFDDRMHWVNHRDHRNTGMSTVDASYPYCRDILFFPEHFEDPEAVSHTVTEYLFVDSYGHVDEVFIDVTDTVGIKTKAIACHESQYPESKAQYLTDLLTKIEGSDRRWERFRYVVSR